MYEKQKQNNNNINNGEEKGRTPVADRAENNDGDDLPDRYDYTRDIHKTFV